MKRVLLTLSLLTAGILAGAPLPPGGGPRDAAFSLQDAWRSSTATREKICLNGFWEFQPAMAEEKKVPETQWGRFLLPGSWTTSLGTRILHLAPEQKRALKDRAWFRREVKVPESWRNRRILVDLDLVQTRALLFVDGVPAGELIYPGGELDLTGRLIPGKRHTIALLVLAVAGGSGGVHMAPGRVIPANSKPDNMGILGDLWLLSRPLNHAVRDVHVIPSVRRKEIRFDIGFADLPAGQYQLRCEVFDGKKRVRQFRSELFVADGSKTFRHSFGGRWEDPKLWDIDTPENLYTAGVTLLDRSGRVLDEFLPEEFGFREFYAEGRDFFLNGKKIHLRAFSSQYIGRYFTATPERVGAMCRMARQTGYNFMISGNYNYNPGIFSYYDSLHRIASKLGVLSAVTLPHFNAFGRKLHEPAVAEEYRKLAEHIIRRFQNVPGVVMYTMNHNAMGYGGDQNPLLFGRRSAPALEDLRPLPVTEARSQGKIAEAVVRELDSSRLIYHHSGARLGDVYTVNCYLNWLPNQERSDYLETWEAEGDMPLFLVEWGLPHVASWSSYRGPEFIWSCKAVQAAWIDEYNSMILGEEAYRPDAAKLAFLKTQEKMLSGNTPVNFNALGGNTVVPFLEDVQRVRALLLRDHVRNLRARGISGLLPWDQSSFWRQTAAGKDRRETLTADGVKRPGIVDEIMIARGGALIDPLGRYELSTTGRALKECFREELGWIGGRPAEFTEKSHTFLPGETVEKSLVMLSDTRRSRKTAWRWRVRALNLEQGGSVDIAPGERAIVAVKFSIPPDFAGTEFTLDAEFSSGCRDQLVIDVISRPEAPSPAEVGLFDPEGTAAPLLRALGQPFRPVRSDAELAGVKRIVIGRNALERMPFDLAGHLARGGGALLLEQSAATLERLGLRSVEYAVREVFPVGQGRILHDWRGSGTLLEPYDRNLLPTDEPKFRWQGFSGTRVWRAGNRGSVASVLLEKPPVGDWLPLYQCGFALQYAPLLYLREGRAQVILCQLEISGRTAEEPEALRVLSEALSLLDSPPEFSGRRVACHGREAQALLRSLKIPFGQFDARSGLLVLGPGGEIPEGLSEKMAAGLHVLAFGLSGDELRRILPEVRTEPGGYCTTLPELEGQPVFRGISVADLAWRDGQRFDAFRGGVPLAFFRCGRGSLTAYQLPPWKFDGKEFYNRSVIRRSTFTAARLLHNLGATAEPGFVKLLTRGFSAAVPQLPVAGWRFRTDPRNIGIREKWHLSSTPMAADQWRQLGVERHFQFQDPALAGYNGYFFYRLEFQLTPEEVKKMRGTLHIGAVDDESWIYLNDRFLGEITAKSHPASYWREPRFFHVGPEHFRAGRNVLVIRGNDLRQTGGLTGAPWFSPDEKPDFYTDSPIFEDHPYRYYRW